MFRGPLCGGGGRKGNGEGSKGRGEEGEGEEGEGKRRESDPHSSFMLIPRLHVSFTCTCPGHRVSVKCGMPSPECM